MIIGMLWESEGQLLDQIPKAVQCFQKKYGHRPTFCQGNLRELSSERLLGSIVAGIEITAGKVPAGHLFVGPIN